MKLKYVLLLITIYTASCSDIKQNSSSTTTDYKKNVSKCN